MKKIHNFWSDKTTKPILIRQVIGGGAALFGLCWIGMVLYPTLQGFWHERERYHLLFMLIPVPMMLAPGFIALFFGVRLFRSMSLDALKWVIGDFFAVGVFMASIGLQYFLADILPEHIALNALLFVLSVAALPIYRAVLRFILPHLDQDETSRGPLIGKVALLLIAFLLWSFLSDTIREYRPIEEGYTNAPDHVWILIGLLVPILAAIGFYRSAAVLLRRNNTCQTAAGDA